MAEFPDFGKHCAFKECKVLDFLPVICDACRQSFCVNHFRYEVHQCTKVVNKDRQVPVCPVCTQPVPLVAGRSPDSVMCDHIDSGCRGSKKSSFLCELKTCKQREFVEVQCRRCKHNFCLKHRFPDGHSCTGNAPNEKLRAQQPKVAEPNTSDDLELARRLQEMWNSGVSDEELARRMQTEEYQRSQNPQIRVGGDRNTADRCAIS